MPEVAFVSYSNADGRCEANLKAFVTQLRADIFSYNPGGFAESECVFFDEESIKTGQDWEKRIADSVKCSKVLVAFCSPHFTSSRFCGKEVQVFLDRLQVWQAANPEVPASSIIAVLWHHSTTIPKALQRFQFIKLPKDEHGKPISLRVLCRLDMHNDRRTQVLLDLAEAIEQARKQDLTPVEVIPPFDKIRSAFDEPVGVRYGVALIDLVAGGADPVALETLVSQAGGPTPFRTLDLGAGFTEAVEAAKENREALLIVTDPATLTKPQFKTAVAAVDAQGGEKTGLVVFDTKAIDPRAVQTAFQKSYAAFWEVRFETTGGVGQRQALSEVIAKLRTRLIGEDPAKEARQEEIVALAQADGIPIDRKPILSGPEGQP